MTHALLIYLAIILTHFISDWFFQSRKVAENKSKDGAYMLLHMSIIFICTIPLGVWLLGVSAGIYAAEIYALIHGAQDWFVWRLYARLRPNQIVPDSLFYKFVAGDQLLHLILLGVIFLG